MKRDIYILIYLLFFTSLLMNAQSITVSAPSHVMSGENFRVAYTINTQDVGEFRAGTFPSGLEVVAGPYTSSQSSFQMVNGHTSSSSSITYTYTVYAEKNGSYTIPSAHARVNGKQISSPVTKVVVSGSAPKNADKAPKMHDDNDAQASMRAAGSAISGKDLFIKVSANKQKVYEQEPILLTYKVYTLVDLTQLEGKMPDLAGFHTQEIKLPQQKSFHVERVNGKNYRCVTWSQYIMYPQMTGILEIPSITFKGIVVQQNRAIDPFEAFFNGGSGYVEVKRNIVAPSIKIQVEPLPKRPQNFSGGVGKFNISAQLDKKVVNAGDPVTLRVVIGGVGNLKLIKQPVIDLPKDFDKYDAKITDKTRLSENGLEGNMIYDFLIVPRNKGTFTIPPVAFTYYDVDKKQYQTVKTNGFNLTVNKGLGKTSEVDRFGDSKGQDIFGIKHGSINKGATDNHFLGSMGYWLIQILSILVFVVLLIVFRKQVSANADLVKLRGKRANKVAKKRLRVANNLMQKGEKAEFYEEVLRALWGYVGDKLNMPVDELSRENIAENFRKHDIDHSLITQFVSVIDDCEFVRYAQGDAESDMQKVFEEATSVIMNIEDAMKGAQKQTESKRYGGYNIVFLLFVCLVPMSALAITKQQVDSLYDKGDYQKAITGYQELLKKTPNSALYYNLGNAYYRSDNITQAVIAYERAYRLSPSDSKVRFNLEFVRSKTIDNISPNSEMFFVVWYRYLKNIMNMDGWAVATVLSLALALIALLIYFFSQRIIIRKAGFYVSMVSLMVFLLSLWFSYQQYLSYSRKNEAIVVAPSVSIKKTPESNSSDEFVIHEGTKVKVIDTEVKGWCEVELPDGRGGWLLPSQIEYI